jgi:alpha-1,3-rhamnosyl/mannosyltransferase
VGVNLLWLVPGVVGGSEEYTIRTLLGLAEQGTDDFELTVFCLRAFVDAHPEVADVFETVTLPLTGREKSMRLAAESSWLGYQSLHHELDLMHHAGGIMPPLRGAPGVLTIHDLQPIVMPEHFNPVKRNFSRIAIPRSAKAARLVLTPSEFTRQSVIDVLDAEPDRVVVVPHGVAPTPAEATPADELRDRYDIDRPYFVFPAITYPHKNHLLLVRALPAVPDALLVLTGGAAQVEDEVLAEADALGVADRVRRPGRVPRVDLDGLLDGATALLFPSLFEGFGAPVLEAMTRGCPVVAADTTALPEVVGDAGILLPPDEPEEWSRVMLDLLANESRRQGLAEAGRARAALFTWGRSADALRAAYELALVAS